MKNKPELSFETIKRMEDMTWFTHAQIFDDLLIAAQRETACYIWKTEEGLVVIDGIWPDERVYEEMLAAIREAGWEEEPITKFVMTHGHIDHVGCGRWLVEHHGAETFLSKEDDILRRETPGEEGRSDGWKDFAIDRYIRDGDSIVCGNKSIKIIATPGHTAGCMSFIFPVYDNGEKHMACLFGGATPPWGDKDGKQLQRRSALKFAKAAADEHCDVALTNHTAFDVGLERIAYSRSRLAYMPNIYILGEDGVRKFLKVFLTVTE